MPNVYYFLPNVTLHQVPNPFFFCVSGRAFADSDENRGTSARQSFVDRQKRDSREELPIHFFHSPKTKTHNTSFSRKTVKICHFPNPIAALANVLFGEQHGRGGPGKGKHTRKGTIAPAATKANPTNPNRSRNKRAGQGQPGTKKCGSCEIQGKRTV